MQDGASSDNNIWGPVLVLFAAMAALGLLLIGNGAQAPISSTTVRVHFSQPTDQAVVPPTFTVQMRAEGLTVEPAGEIHEGAGHFHILIDQDWVPGGEVVPLETEGYLHFGKGQTETELTLTPGTHVLRLQFADGAHQALSGDAYRDEITVFVEEAAPPVSVRFVAPTDGETVSSTFTVVMAASGIQIEPAGDIHDAAGHFHILVDKDWVPAGEVIPLETEGYLHFGKAQTQAELTLEPGEHTLRLQVANGAHQALEGDEYRAEITVTVE